MDPCAQRREQLARRLHEEQLDALIINSPVNVTYLTGFTGSAGLLLVSAQATVLVTDFRYATQAPQEAVGIDVQIDPSSIWDRLGRVLLQWNVERLGVESHVLTTRDADRLSRLTRSRLVQTTDLVEHLRAAKDAGEVDAIRNAARLAQEALAEVLPEVRAGDRELDVAARLEQLGA